MNTVTEGAWSLDQRLQMSEAQQNLLADSPPKILMVVVGRCWLKDSAALLSTHTISIT